MRSLMRKTLSEEYLLKLVAGAGILLHVSRATTEDCENSQVRYVGKKYKFRRMRTQKRIFFFFEINS